MFRPTDKIFSELSGERRCFDTRYFGLVDLRALAPLQHRFQQRKKERAERETLRTPTPRTLALRVWAGEARK